MKGLGCSKRSENIINQKIGCFYFEAMPKISSEVQQKIFFREILKKIKKNVPILDFGNDSLLLTKIQYESLPKPQYGHVFSIFFI